MDRGPMKIAVALFVSVFLSAVAGNAQVSGGAITGTVTNESGAVVPGVQISVREVSTGIVRAGVTDSAGLYSVGDLSAGMFEMTVSASGFVSQVWTSISVTAGVERILNVSLKAGKALPATRVVAPPALVSEPCPATCGSANSSTVRDTPLNGRDWAALATLQAGVSSVQNGSATGGGNMDRGFGAAVSISGSRPDENAYILDGISINDYANGAPGSVLGDNLGIDAVQQVAVLGSNYPAEYGRTGGGVISVETTKGTNTFHGSIYEFLRNSSLDARNFFDGPVIPPFKRNQFGGSGGLPIKKDKTYIFGDYEGLRQSLGVTTVSTVPSPAARGGTLSFTDPSQFPSGCTALSQTQCQVTVDPQIAKFLAANFFPLPTDPVAAGSNIGLFRFSAQEITNENYATARFDHKFTDRDSIYATYMRDYSTTVQPGTFGELFSDLVSNRQAATIHEQHIFGPKLLNVAQIGATRAVGIEGKVDHITSAYQSVMADHQYAFVPGGYAGDIQSIPGVTSFQGAPTALGYIPSSRSMYWTTYQGGDYVALVHGIHSMKFGGQFERMQDNEVSASNINGLFRFDSLAQFLQNQPTLFSGTGTPLPLDIGIRQTLFGAFAEDDIKAKKTLTVNLGLRYEMVTVPTESHGLTTVLPSLGFPNLPAAAAPICGVSAPGCAGVGPLFKNPTLRNFEPRLGFAWNPRSGRTLFRGGFGVFDVLPLPYEFTLSFQRAAPFTRTIVGVDPPPGSFTMDPVNGSLAYQQFSGQTNTNLAYYAEQNPKRNYVMQWNLSVARELSSKLALTVGYVGSRGVHLPYRVDNIDMALPTPTSYGYMWPCGPDPKGNACASGYLPTGTLSSPVPNSPLNPNFGRINATLWQANSFYHAMQVDLAERVTHGIQFHAAYTFGKSIDTLSASEANDSYPNGLFNQLFFDQRTTRGLSDFNVAQTLVLSATWEIPSPNKGPAFAEWALGGWQLVGLYKASTGQPFTPIMGGDPLGMLLDETGEVPNVVPGCNPVNKNFKTLPTPLYLNANCFALPSVPTSAVSSLPFPCAPFPALSSTSTVSYCANLRGDLGRNAIIGPGLSKLDFSVFKNNYIHRISETFNVQFRAEIFNIFNRANFGSPTDNLQAFDNSGAPQNTTIGLLDSTQTTSRQIQFALKLIW